MNDNPGSLKIVFGDLFESRCQTITNAVNCVGVMGKGIALAFKRRYPEMFLDYAARCKKGEVQIGKPFLFKRNTAPWILNFPTKTHWRSPSRLEDIERGLDYLAANASDWGIESLALPALGCGLGGIEWNAVAPLIIAKLESAKLQIELYAPPDTAQHELSIAPTTT